MGDKRIITRATGLWQALATCVALSGSSHIIDDGCKGQGDPAGTPRHTPPPEQKPSRDPDAALS